MKEPIMTQQEEEMSEEGECLKILQKKHVERKEGRIYQDT